MAAAPRLFDRELLRARRRRAAQSGNFLLEHAAEDLADRLRTVQRRFAFALDLGSPGEALRRALDGQVETIVACEPLAQLRERSLGPRVAADPEALPFATGAFDLIVSGLALHWVNDLPGALAQARRALRSDGLLLAALLGGETLFELRRCLAEAEAEIEGGASPRVAPFGDVRQLGSLLQRAGFALPVTDVDRLTVRYKSVESLFRDLRSMGATNTLIERSRKPLRRATLTRAASLYAEHFADADGRLRATFDLVWLSGWAPDASQQKPLRPGSARARLADALGTQERSAGERAGPRKT